jgi:hypothetical protein
MSYYYYCTFLHFFFFDFFYIQWLYQCGSTENKWMNESINQSMRQESTISNHKNLSQLQMKKSKLRSVKDMKILV